MYFTPTHVLHTHTRTNFSPLPDTTCKRFPPFVMKLQCVAGLCRTLLMLQCLKDLQFLGATLCFLPLSLVLSLSRSLSLSLLSLQNISEIYVHIFLLHTPLFHEFARTLSLFFSRSFFFLVLSLSLVLFFRPTLSLTLSLVLSLAL